MYCEVTYIPINGRDYGSLLRTVLSFIQSTFALFVMRQDQNRSDFTFRSSSSICWSLLIKTIAKLVKQEVNTESLFRSSDNTLAFRFSYFIFSLRKAAFPSQIYIPRVRNLNFTSVCVRLETLMIAFFK